MCLVRRLVVVGAPNLAADTIADQLGLLASVGERDRELALGHWVMGGIARLVLAVGGHGFSSRAARLD